MVLKLFMIMLFVDSGTLSRSIRKGEMLETDDLAGSKELSVFTFAIAIQSIDRLETAVEETTLNPLDVFSVTLSVTDELLEVTVITGREPLFSFFENSSEKLTHVSDPLTEAFPKSLTLMLCSLMPR